MNTPKLFREATMPRLHMTDRSVRDLKAPPAPQQAEYFDDVAKGGVQGLILRQSYGGTRTWFCMYYEQGGKSRTIKLGRYPILSLSEARAAARKFLQDPKTHIEARSPADTFKKVADDFIELHVKKEKLRTGDVIEQRIEKHLRPKFDGYELPRSVAAT
jgi:hypothetical protein